MPIEVEYVECIYCGAETTADQAEEVPCADDDESWGRLAELHGRSCEWVQTRAHSIDDE